jgi:hypothetical protein
VREMCWADIVPPRYFEPPAVARTYRVEVRDTKCNLLGSVAITTRDRPWYECHPYWTFVLRQDIEISYPPKDAQCIVNLVDLEVSEFRVSGRSGQWWYGFKTDIGIEQLKRIPSFVLDARLVTAPTTSP